jgi:hypothetical protein
MPVFEPDDATDADPSALEDSALEDAYRRAPVGAMTVAGIATALVFALWAAFYLTIFLPRGLLQ